MNLHKDSIKLNAIREICTSFNERKVMFMSIEKLILNAATHYHANLIDIHNALHALGLRSDEQAEEFNKKHVMKLVEMYDFPFSTFNIFKRC